MGLDGVELVVAVEEKFGIGISDGEAEKVVTPRDVAELVVRKVSSRDDGGCRSQRAFHLIRRELQAMGVPRRAVRPAARLADLFWCQRRWSRKVWWQGLRERLGVQYEPHWKASAPYVRPRAFPFPRHLTTVRDAAEWLAERRAGEYGKAYSREQVEAVLPELIVEQLGIARDQFRWDAEFVRDYGMD